MSRQILDTLRAGWPLDPVKSEIIPLIQLLELHKYFPEIALRLMNTATAKVAEYLIMLPQIQ
tara:strand:- start:560 stop:745 length:186 start_codon:yes stop_codon:yes gene_type:complete